MTKKIKLTQGKFALVDDDDYKKLNKHKWFAVKYHKTYYAKRNAKVNNKWKPIYMHRVIMQLRQGDGKELDHQNRNGLDNQKTNLRIVSRSENMRNNGKFLNSKSGYTGVYWYEPLRKWHAQICINYKNIHLGYFPKKDEAIKARRQGEIKYWNDS